MLSSLLGLIPHGRVQGGVQCRAVLGDADQAAVCTEGEVHGFRSCLVPAEEAAMGPDGVGITVVGDGDRAAGYDLLAPSEDENPGGGPEIRCRSPCLPIRAPGLPGTATCTRLG